MGLPSDRLRLAAARQHLLHSLRGAAQGLVPFVSDPGGLRAVRHLDLDHRQRAGESAQRAGLMLNISPVILGLTVLAWGNSLGDLVADTSLARQGYPQMAIGGVFACGSSGEAVMSSSHV